MFRYEPYAIDPTAQVSETAVIGAPFRPLLDGRCRATDRKTIIGPEVWIGHNVTVGQGSTISSGSIIDDHALIEAEVTLGARVLVAGRAQIGLGAHIGDDSIIKGYVSDYCHVGNNCRIFGDLIHRQLDPTVPWDDPTADEPSPFIGDGALVGWRAVVVGGVKIGEGAYICAGALVTKDVPSGFIAFGKNSMVLPDEWRGDLAGSPFFSVRPV